MIENNTRRSFLGKLTAAIAAPIIPVAAPAIPVMKTVYDETKVNDILDSWKAGSFNRSQPTALGGFESKVCFQGRNPGKSLTSDQMRALFDTQLRFAAEQQRVFTQEYMKRLA